LPEGKLWIAGNNKPVITETNIGTWDRVRLIPFLVSFIGREDRGLEAKLRNELPGILNWILAGFQYYKQEGLKVPDQIRKATEDYRIECNTLLSYTEQYCIKSHLEGCEIGTSVFYERYKNYCETDGLYAYSNKRVKVVLKSGGINVKHTAGGDRYIGIIPKDLMPEYLKNKIFLPTMDNSKCGQTELLSN